MRKSKSLPQLPSSSSSTHSDTSSFSFVRFIKHELNLDQNNDQNELNDQVLTLLYKSPDNIRHGVYNYFIRVPLALEKFILYAVLLCFDSFLYNVTFLPLRMIIICKKILFFQQIHVSNICDILRVMAIVICLVFWMPIYDYSLIYHFIRGQSTLKLYVTYNMLELFDKLSCAFGMDIQDTMFYASTKAYFEKKSLSERFYLILQSIFAIIVFLVYLFVHTTLILLRIITLNVALNSSNNALFTLLLSNNFLELRKPIFKKFAKENLFQFACHDATERFQFLVFGVVIAMQNSKAAVFSGDEIRSIAYCLISEMVVDMLKHAFITKFNNIHPSVYYKFEDKLCEDMTDNRFKETFLDNMNIVARRLGFTPIPMICIMLHVLHQYLRYLFPDDSNHFLLKIYACSFVVVVCFKILTSLVSLGHACKRCIEKERYDHEKRLILNGTKETKPKKKKVRIEVEKSEDYDNGKLNLDAIYRFSLFGKRIPD